jgi:opacity protein-like surface antigen
VGVPVPGTGGLVVEELSTDNWLMNAGIGPQVMARSGAVRPYAYALAGVGYFATETTFGDSGYWSASTTNFDDTTFAWAAGAGLLFRLSRDLALDVGVQYVGNGEVRYLAEGDLVPSPDGSPPVIVPRRTEANLVTVTVGLTFGR